MRARALVSLLLVCIVAGCGGDAGEDAPGADARAAQQEGPDRSNPLLQPASFDERAPDQFRARFETSEGDFVIEVHRDWAPHGADRFYNLVKAGYYDDVRFHRVLGDFVAEFGIHGDPWVNAAWRQATFPDDPVEVSNTRGRVSFTRAGPRTRTTQVFVNLKDNPGLDDQGFSPFGEVVDGMDVVESLYSGYGDGPPRGETGVYKAMALARGNEYLDEEFPELDRIESARIGGGE